MAFIQCALNKAWAQVGHERSYRFIRHPGYFGEILSVLGIGLALSSIVGLSMVILLALLIIMRVNIEERMLLAEFGDNYLDYAMKTNKIVPFIF
jgi:protein-S-isoprenylcysteine O-methyltransferase Ste14